MTEDNIKKVADILLKNEYIVALTGSGISVASGLELLEVKMVYGKSTILKH